MFEEDELKHRDFSAYENKMCDLFDFFFHALLQKTCMRVEKRTACACVVLVREAIERLLCSRVWFCMCSCVVKVK